MGKLTMRIRPNLLLIPVTIILLAMLGNAIDCDVRFRELFPIQGTLAAEKYLVVLGLCVVGVLLTIKHSGR